MEPTLSSTLSSTLSPGSEDSGLEEPESAVEREIRRTLEREECHRRERGGVTQGLTVPRYGNTNRAFTNTIIYNVIYNIIFAMYAYTYVEYDTIRVHTIDLE